jgi:hypothetical protein
MADYYPLLARAVSGLKTSTPEARRAIYDRARNALIGQLRGMSPPVPEPDILRESAALDAAVAQLEAELTRAPDPQAQERARAEEERARAEEERALAERRAQEDEVRATLEAEAERKALERKAQERKALEQKAQERQLQERPANARAAEDRDAEDRKAEERKAEERKAEERKAKERQAEALRLEREAEQLRQSEAARLARDVQNAQIQNAQTKAEEQRQQDARQAEESRKLREAREAQAEREKEVRDAEAKAQAARERDEARRGAQADADSDLAEAAAEAPTLATRKPNAKRRPAGAGHASDLDALSDEAESHAFDLHAPSRAARPAAPTPPVERSSNLRFVVVGATLALVMGAIAATAWMLRDRPQEAGRPAPAPSTASSAETSGKITERAGAAPSAPVPTVTVPTQPIRPQTDSVGPPAAQPAQLAPTRAAFLIQNLSGPEPHTVYSGSATWRAENGVWRAEVTVPEVKLNASLAMSKNAEDGPASHKIELRFEFADPQYQISRIGAPEMRREDNPFGDKIAGVSVQVTPNFYLVGLRKGAAESAYNLELIRSRGWIDIPMEMSDKRIAKLTIEKGPAGDQTLATASTGW